VHGVGLTSTDVWPISWQLCLINFMKTIAAILIWLTLWCDLCLIVGVIFTGTYGSAVINIGSFSVDSKTHGGASFIVFIAMWTGALAICGLLKSRIQKSK
jgi:hypothetical protein